MSQHLPCRSIFENLSANVKDNTKKQLRKNSTNAYRLFLYIFSLLIASSSIIVHAQQEPVIHYVTKNYSFTKGIPVSSFQAPSNSGSAVPNSVQGSIVETNGIGVYDAGKIVRSSDGNAISILTDSGVIQKVNLTNKTAANFLTNRSKPWGIVKDSHGNIFWAETGSSTIIINPDQNNSTSIANTALDGLGLVSGALGKAGDVIEGINTIREVYSGLTGDDLVSKITGEEVPPKYILKFSGVIYKLAPGATTPVAIASNVQLPTGLAIDKNDNLYVTCFSAKFKVNGFEFTGDGVDVVDESGNYDAKVIKIDLNNNNNTTDIGSYPGIDYPNAIGVDDDFELYVHFYNSDFTKNRVAFIPKYADPAVTTGATYQHASLLIDQSTLYEDMAVDGYGNIYLSDLKSDKIYVCPSTSTGVNDLLVFSDKVRAPRALYVDKSNNQLWVKDGKFINTGSIKKLNLFGYNITPALPDGLTLNGDGTISGTPKAISSSKSYTITGSNAIGVSNDVITIAVNQISAPNITYATSSYSFPVSSAITTIAAPSNSGGAFNLQKGPLKIDTVYKGGTANEGFAFDAAGNSYFTQPDSGRIMKITPLGQASVLLSGLNYPVDIAIDRNSGFFYFSERGANKVKLLYPGFTNPIDVLIVGTPSGLAIDDSSYLYVLNQGSGTIIKYNPRANTVKDNYVTGLNQPYNISVYNNTLYVRDIYGVIKTIPISNNPSVSTLTTVANSWGMTMDDYGNIYAAGYGGINKIPVSTSTPAVYAGSLNISYARGIETDANNNLYVSMGTKGEIILKITPDGYTVSPALPAGLVLNNNGTISGTPATVSSAQNYTVSASNTGGKSDAVLSITITNIATTNLQYTTPNSYNRGKTITALTPTVSGGVPSGYIVSPSLPSGLSLDGTTGKITGTPTVNQGATSYTITANNPAGNKSATISIAITDELASNLQYNFPHTELLKNYSVGSITPTYSGSSASSFDISPGLPAGLSFNTSTGVISGTPTGTSTSTSYTVTLHNGAGTTTTTFSLSVTNAPIPNISYPDTVYKFTRNVAINTIPKPTNTGNPFPQQSIRDTAILGIASATGVAIDASGNTYIAYGTGTIKKLAKGGTQFTDFITSGISSPVDLAVDNAGNMYVSEGSNNSIKKIVLSTGNVTTFANSGLGNVQGLYISSNNDLYVADYTNQKIVKYANCNAGSKSDVLTGLNAPDGFNYGGVSPYDVTIDTSGNMYVLLSGPWTSGSVSYIYKYPVGGGARIETARQINKYTYVIVDKTGNVYYSSVNAGIQRVNGYTNSPNGGIFSNLNSSATACGLALDADENVFYAINNSTSASGGLGISYQFGYNSASLPAGLALNPNGTITGTPTALQAQTEHSVTASSFYGSSTAKLKIIVVDAIPAFAYSNPNQALTKNVTNLSITPTSTGGPITSYTYAPAQLPAGISFNASTGLFSGTATQLQDTISTYIVSAANTGGTCKDTVTFQVLDAKPTTLTYNTNNVLLVDKPFTDLNPTVSGGGPVTKYTVTPSLPAGLFLDSIKGIISGKPTATQSATNYTIKATNSGGFASAVINIAVNNVPPDITYVPNNTFKFKQNQSITSISAPGNSGGPINSYSTPGLAAGLTLNTGTGIITGTPTQIKESTEYKIIADGGVWGKDTAYLNIEVVPLPPDSIKYSTPITVIKGSAMQSQSPMFTTSGGGAITKYSISPGLPPGLTIDPSTGVISGTPTAIMENPGQVYYVYAENGAGKTYAPILFIVKDLPPVVSYNSENVFTLSKDTAFTVNTTGGAVTKYTIDPALPAGLTLDSVTGKINGIPSALSTRTQYTITAVNYGNTSATAQCYITIVAPKPVISYTTSQVYTRNVSNVNLSVSSTGGAVVSYSISPALPAGLSLNTSTGAITGTPMASAVAKDYTVTATNTGGTTTATINIKVINAVPVISYNSTNVYTKGVQITDLSPTSTGGSEIVYTISPALPNGLSISSSTGVISGTPTTITAQNNYTITATNDGGTDDAVISITVNDKAPGSLSYNQSNNYYVGYAITDLTPSISSGGGTILSFAINPATLPDGLSFNTSTGVISGTPTSEFTETEFTVTATNSGGNSQAVFTISVTALSATINGTDVTCHGGTNGTATVTVTGGKAPVSYSWSPSGGNAATATGLGAGTYTCTITDANLKSIEKQITLTEPLLATVNSVNDATLCLGDNINTITFSGSNNTGYTWTNDNTAIGLTANGSGNIAGFTPANTTADVLTANIIVTAKDNTCSGSTASFKIVVKPAVTVTDIDSQVLCNSSSSDAIIFSGNATGTTYSWTNDNTSIGLAANGNGDITSFTATNTGATPVIATITVMPSANGCTGTPKTFTITVNPTPTVNAINNQTLCNNSAATAISFSGIVGGTTYSWTNDKTSIGLAASGNGNIASFTATNSGSAPVIATITVTPSANGCTGTPKTFTITVNPTPTVNAIDNQTLCNNSATTAISFSGIVGGTTYSWTNDKTSIGLAVSDNGNIASFTATNTGASPVTATITVTPSANGCTGVPKTFTITVNPTPTVNAIDNQTLCNNSAATAISFGGIVGGTTYSWTNDKTSIGLAASGNGNIASFSATNTGASPVTATITVTPSANSCTGASKTFTITVNPTPTVNAIDNQTLCNNSATTAINFGGTADGTTYSWTNDKTSIGLAASGNGDISSFAATNARTTPVVATITVTPSANGCTGASKTFTITVNPISTVNAIDNQTLCNNSATTAISFSGAVNGTTYSWTNDKTSIGLAASGNGDIASFTATNTGAAPVTATITVTPSANGCVGTTSPITITVNPTPSVSAIPVSQTICSGSNIQTIELNSGVDNTSFNWIRDNNTDVSGIDASGAGNISGALNNNTHKPASVIFTVTPSANECTGEAKNFTVTINPVSQMNEPGDIVVCNTGAISTAFTTVNSGGATTYNWTATNHGTGIGATSGNGDISFNGNNSGAVPVTDTVTITPQFSNGGIECAGESRTFVITVNPTPAVSISLSPFQTIIPGQVTGVFSNVNIPDGQYKWYYNGNYINEANPWLINRTIDNLGKYKLIYTDPDGCVSTSNEIVLDGTVTEEVFMYPNPSDGRFQVRCYSPVAEKVKVNVYNLQGRKIYGKDYDAAAGYSKLWVELRTVTAGDIYIVELVTASGKQLSRQKILIRK